MLDVKYILSLLTPLVILVVYTSTLPKEVQWQAVARNSAPDSLPFQGKTLPPLPKPVVRTDEYASAYEIFVLEEWCSSRCQADVSRSLKEQFHCTKIKLLPEFRYVEARCDGIRSMSPHEIAENVVQEVTGVKKHIDNRRMPSAGIGERIDSRSLSSRQQTVLEKGSIISRLTQSISELLPWGLDRIDQQEGQDGKFDLSCFPRLGKGVVVYVLDTGCRDTHQELRGRTSLKKVGRYTTSADDNGHGTHIAGSAAGTDYGVCKLCDVVCIKTLDENNVGTLLDVVEAVEYVLEQKKEKPGIPAVAIMSLGGSLETDILDIAVNKLANANVFPSIAAGNGFANSCTWTPARAELGITVGATMKDDVMRFSSNYGGCVSIAAPGEDIRSASHLGDSLYVSMSGTSMAAPYVAGVAALMLGENPDLKPSQLLAKMKLKGKMLNDDFHDFRYPLLRILNDECHLYGFPERKLSGSPSIEVFPQGLPSVEFSRTPSSSAAASNSPTPSATGLPSTSPFTSPVSSQLVRPTSSPSGSPSTTILASQTPSSQNIPPSSFAQSATPLATKSSFQGHLRSTSPSGTSSLSPSSSITASPSEPEISVSNSLESRSPTPTHSPSSSSSQSVSASPSPSASASFSESLSHSASRSPSSPQQTFSSPSPSLRGSKTASSLDIQSSSPSSTPTPLRSHSRFPSLSRKPAASISPVHTLEQTAFKSISPSITSTPSMSEQEIDPGVSRTPSISPSSSSSQSVSASPSHSASASFSESLSPSTSHSPSSPNSSSPSPTPTPSRSEIQFPSPSRTPAASISPVHPPEQTAFTSVSPSITPMPSVPKSKQTVAPSVSRASNEEPAKPSVSPSPFHFVADIIA